MLDKYLESSWHQKLAPLFATEEMLCLVSFLRRQKAAGKKIYPPHEKIFNAFLLTPFERVKIVILGQDPYHGPGQANGLSFSVEAHLPVPPSLKNIYKELLADLGLPQAPHGDLTAWAKQGVLLLNSCLTVEEACAGSHQNRGWEPFTDAVMDVLNRDRANIVFILWGRKALQRGRFIDPKKHLLITSAHPSPLSAHNGFFGSSPFSRANAYLADKHIRSIDWRLS